jgi:catechol 2,3-dioxygenase-like lactoylglutathione lyase family enzyme
MSITDRATRTPILSTVRLGHGTLECADLARTRRFYEEVLGLDVIQTSRKSLMIRKGTTHTYAVIETGKTAEERVLSHNGLDVDTPEQVDAAYERILQVKDEYGIRKITKPRVSHGDRSFFFCDLDGNWWEIVAVRPGGYAMNFDDPASDLTGRHELEEELNRMPAGQGHTHNLSIREIVKSGGSKS